VNLVHCVIKLKLNRVEIRFSLLNVLVVTPCGRLGGYQHFRGTSVFIFKGRFCLFVIYLSTLFSNLDYIGSNERVTDNW
jgi:hypothetical protein